MKQLIHNSRMTAIGDMLGAVPMMIELARGDGLEVQHANCHWVYPFLEVYGIKLVDKVGSDAFKPDLDEAFSYSHQNRLYMTQCWHHQVGLPVPAEPLRPRLAVPDMDVPVYDFVFAPFANSLPEDHKWNMSRWQDLAKETGDYGYRTCMVGNSKSDLRPLPEIEYCDYKFDLSMTELINILRKCRYGCVSVVTGISHLCYAFGVKNYVLCNQDMQWGRNPDAVFIEKKIPEVTVSDVLETIKNQ